LEKILLVGNPNVGKSVLFNLLTGSYATVSNYPGTTVEVTRGRLRGLGRRPEVIDTPGINSLTPLSLDEVVTRDIILREKDYIVVQVIDARNLARGLRITAELGDLGVPVVIALNMMDEALRAGTHVSTEKLSEVLGVEVIGTVAVERRGIGELFQALKAARQPRLEVRYPEAIEEALGQIACELPDAEVGKRGLAIMFLSGDEGIERWLEERVSQGTMQRLREVRRRAQEAFAEPLDYVIATARWKCAEAVAQSVSVHRTVTASRARELVSTATMHPLWGPMILLVVLYAMYLMVGKLGAGIIVDFMSHCIVGTPGEVVMGLGVERQPAELNVSGGEIVGFEGEEARVQTISPARIVKIVMRPGPRCPKFLRKGIPYRLDGYVNAADGALPRVAVRLAYPSGGEELRVALRPEDSGGGYWLQDEFSPKEDGARWEVSIDVSGADQVVLRSVVLQREAEGLLNPWLSGMVREHVRSGFLQYVLVGEYGIITMGLGLVLGIVLPIVVVFFLFLGLIEDSGYLARLTVLSNRVFTWMGLNGRACVPVVLGLGCDTMATLSARVLDSQNARLLVIFLLALGVPCSAQLGIIMAMAGAIGPAGLMLVGGVVVGELFAAGYVGSRLLGGTNPDFIVEIPLLRAPTLANVARKTWQRAEWFLREGMPHFILGTAFLGIMSWFGVLEFLESILRPIVSGLLSLPPEAAYAFLIGFLRRDYGAAGLFDLRYEGRLDNLQTVVALITMTLFVPCMANFLVMVKEQGLKRAAIMVVIIIVLALATGGLVNWTLRGLGVSI
jgi:ferrous iron transport protein B